jgi:hypothetical protein
MSESSNIVWRACNLTSFSPCLTGPVDYPFASHHKEPGFKTPGGDLCETRILLLALSCYIGDPDVIDHCSLVDCITVRNYLASGKVNNFQNSRRLPIFALIYEAPGHMQTLVPARRGLDFCLSQDGDGQIFFYYSRRHQRKGIVARKFFTTVFFMYLL